MIKELFAATMGAAAMYLTKSLGFYPIILLMVLIELLSLNKRNHFTNLSFLLGMFVSEAYFLYSNSGIMALKYFVYVGFYLLFRFKGNDWFVDNKVNEYLYLLFAISVPIFLDFITRMMGIEVDLLLFSTLYLIFLRLSDWILKTKLSVAIFSLTQIVSAYSLGQFILQDSMKIYFVVIIVLWTLKKWKTGGIVDVRRLSITNLFGKSRKGLY
jgi:hypothetical protein